MPLLKLAVLCSKPDRSLVQAEDGNARVGATGVRPLFRPEIVIRPSTWSAPEISSPVATEPRRPALLLLPAWFD